MTDEKSASALDIARLIDHTLLKPEASKRDIEALCAEARRFRFASVCVNPFWVPLATELLAGAPVKICTVVGFPLGANQTSIKMAEAETALRQGARELDMVQNIGALRSGDYDTVREEIRSLASLCHAQNASLKVILENCLLTDEEKITACRVAVEANADFVKTSTGFAAGGANAADVRLMRRAVPPGTGVKAAGGIRTFAALREMLEAGATRIGTSSGAKIINEMNDDESTAEPIRLNVVRVPGGGPDTY